MRIRAVIAGVAVSGALVAALLSGCAADQSGTDPTRHATPAPVFTSDAQALAAAEDAYAKYQAMEDRIASEGGVDPDRIRPLASRDALETALSSFADYRTSGEHSTGNIRFDGSILLGRKAGTHLNVVEIATCIDVAAVDLLDATGQSLIPDNRVARQPFVLDFDVRDGSLVLSDRNKNSKEASVCA